MKTTLAQVQEILSVSKMVISIEEEGNTIVVITNKYGTSASDKQLAYLKSFTNVSASESRFRKINKYIASLMIDCAKRFPYQNFKIK